MSSVLFGEIIVVDSSNGTFYHQLEYGSSDRFHLLYSFDNADFDRHCNMIASQITKYDNIIPTKS